MKRLGRHIFSIPFCLIVLSLFSHASARADNAKVDTVNFAKAVISAVDSSGTDSVAPDPTPAYLTEPQPLKPFSREAWKKACKGLDYSETPTPKPKEFTHSSWSADGLFADPSVKYVFVGLIIALLAFLLFKLLDRKSVV